jgi:hypothetical protein
MINIDMNQEVWYDNKVVKFIKESDECGGMSIIEINGKKTHAYTKGIYTLEQISNMFTKETPLAFVGQGKAGIIDKLIQKENSLDSDVEELFKSKRIFHTNNMNFSHKEYNTVRQALQPKSISDEEIKVLFDAIRNQPNAHSIYLGKEKLLEILLRPLEQAFINMQEELINKRSRLKMEEQEKGIVLKERNYHKSKLEKAREEVTNMMIEFDEMGFEVTTTTPNTIQEIKKRYFAPINNILGDEKNE